MKHLIQGVAVFSLFALLAVPFASHAASPAWKNFQHSTSIGATSGGVVLGASTSGLTESQITSILSVLRAFGADQSVITNVENSLRGSTGTGISPSLKFSSPVSGRAADITLTLPNSFGKDPLYVVYVLNPISVLKPVSSGGLFGSAVFFNGRNPGVWQAHLALTQAHEGFATNQGGVHWFPIPAGTYKITAVVYPSSPFKSGTDMEYLSIGTEPPALSIINSETFAIIDTAATGLSETEISSTAVSITSTGYSDANESGR